MKDIKTVPQFLLMQVINPHYHRKDALKNMQEAEQLVQTFGGKVIRKDVQHKVHPDPATYIGSGKLEEVSELVKEQKIDIVVLNDIVKSGQLFRIEKFLWKVNTKIQVWDRVDLILNIFEQHAKSPIAKLQIELARIQHQGPRIFGLGKTALSRQGGGIGTRGMGETNIEVEKRIIKDRISKLKKDLRKLRKQQKKKISKRKNQGMSTIALVGYTSAGKTTLFNALTKKEKKIHASLFTTLDSVVGRLSSDEGILISDTIGFIEDLPPSLIDSFKSTLMESMEAKMLLHVIDAADPKYQEKMRVVDKILKSLKIKREPVLVFNKIDLLKDKELEDIKKQYLEKEIIFISAKDAVGLEEINNLKSLM